MGDKSFLISESLQEGWRLTKKYISFLVLYQIILLVLTLIFGGGHGAKWAPWHALGWVVIVLAKMGLYNSCLLITLGIEPSFNQLYKNWRLFVSWVVANFLFVIMLLIGFALLIVPAFYILARYGFFPFFILDKNVGPIEALKLAAKVSDGIRLQILLLFLTCIGINFLGLLCLGIGLFVTIPITLLALTIVYRKIVVRAQ